MRTEKGRKRQDMQNRYVGDVGDFGKYGLLRALCAPAGNNSVTRPAWWSLVPRPLARPTTKTAKHAQLSLEKSRWTNHLTRID